MMNRWNNLMLGMLTLIKLNLYLFKINDYNNLKKRDTLFYNIIKERDTFRQLVGWLFLSIDSQSNLIG
jgi:hypothetical protein